MKRIHRQRIAAIVLGTAVIGVAAMVWRNWMSWHNWNAVYRTIDRRFPGVPTMTPSGLDSLVARVGSDGVVLLDVRTTDEYAVSHLAGAVSAPGLEAAERALQELPPKTTVVAYCSIGYRSARMVYRLRRRGYARVYNLRGSIFAWVNTGRSVFRDGRPVRAVHPFSGFWGRLLRPDYHSWRSAGT